MKYRNMMFLIGFMLAFAGIEVEAQQVTPSTSEVRYRYAWTFPNSVSNNPINLTVIVPNGGSNTCCACALACTPPPATARSAPRRPRRSTLSPNPTVSMGVQSLVFERDTALARSMREFENRMGQTMAQFSVNLTAFGRSLSGFDTRLSGIERDVHNLAVREQGRPGGSTTTTVVRPRSSIARAAPVVGAIASLVTLGFVVANNCCNSRKLVVSYGVSHGLR